jgi:hypothetical protein
MSKPRNRRAQRKKKSPPAPVLSQTDLERCHRRWLCLWFGVTGLLEKEEPWAHDRLRVKLERHGLISAAIVEPDGKGYLRERASLQGGFTRTVPSDALLLRAAAFSADDTPVPLRGRARARPPALRMAMSYFSARAAAEKQPGAARLRGEGAAERAYQRVAKEYGYSVETCRKEIKRGRRQLAQLLAPRGRPRPA